MGIRLRDENHFFMKNVLNPCANQSFSVWFLTTDSGPKSHQYSTTFFTKSWQGNAPSGQKRRPLATLPSGQRPNGGFDTAPPPDHTHAHTAALPSGCHTAQRRTPHLRLLPLSKDSQTSSGSFPFGATGVSPSLQQVIAK